MSVLQLTLPAAQTPSLRVKPWHKVDGLSWQDSKGISYFSSPPILRENFVTSSFEFYIGIYTQKTARISKKGGYLEIEGTFYTAFYTVLCFLT